MTNNSFSMPPMQHHPKDEEFTHESEESCELDGIGKLGHLFRAGFSLIQTTRDTDSPTKDVEWGNIDEFAWIVEYVQNRNEELSDKYKVSTGYPLIEAEQGNTDSVYFDEGSVDVDSGSTFSIEKSIDALRHTYNNVLEERIANRNKKVKKAAERLTTQYHIYCRLFEDDQIEVFTACVIPDFTFESIKRIEDRFDIELIENHGNGFESIKKEFEKQTDSVLLTASDDVSSRPEVSIDGVNPVEFGYEYPIECLMVREVTEDFLDGKEMSESSVENHPLLPWYGALSCNCRDKTYHGWLMPLCRHEMHVINVISNEGMGMVDSENRLPQRFKRVAHPDSFTEIKEIL